MQNFKQWAEQREEHPTKTKIINLIASAGGGSPLSSGRMSVTDPDNLHSSEISLILKRAFDVGGNDLYHEILRYYKERKEAIEGEMRKRRQGPVPSTDL